ncbi:tRNA 2-selenouridine(34) synthase MnmH [Paracoccus jeotgali]|uniref:tRNA 2-selenouridine(34) synthase MnmH n=1 Tax=Paracoccus jeotgali TaxID=2065379 RepID=A0A2K9MBJ0_9RHOB|nr:tRNA 2-selenouridine(34) synthase MnmH [Paracoccus jeotgali]AUM73011.1 tRNA 2-selenouridine(34) synthase MnmH [Paracoccus jeotgali]
MRSPDLIRLETVGMPQGFDALIDVRSPAEFAQDHLPGAINLPVLSDSEHARVGTLYKQVSPFDARKLGGALVAANVARHVQGPLAGHDGAWQPLVYCWRGGQRSGAMATILAQIGWRVGRIEGGYKSWRAQVVRRVQELGFPSPVVVLDGNTGSGKTALLGVLAGRGHQVIDLEGLAHHRGSLFGHRGPQPGQKLFEGRLAAALEGLDPSRPVLVEAESSRIGTLGLPKAVWTAITAAPRLALQVPLAERARFSARDYADITDQPGEVQEILGRLASLHPAERIESWLRMADGAAWRELAHELMQHHYDPRYARSRGRHLENLRGTVALDDLRDLDAAASRIETALRDLALI